MPSSSPTLIAVPLEGGRTVEIPESIREMFRGLDEEGHLVVCHPDMPTHPETGEEYLYGLTKCCYASAKGCEDGIACRSCYADCSWSLGGPATLAVRAVEVTNEVLPDGTPIRCTWTLPRSDDQDPWLVEELDLKTLAALLDAHLRPIGAEEDGTSVTGARLAGGRNRGLIVATYGDHWIDRSREHARRIVRGEGR